VVVRVVMAGGQVRVIMVRGMRVIMLAVVRVPWLVVVVVVAGFGHACNNTCSCMRRRTLPQR